MTLYEKIQSVRDQNSSKEENFVAEAHFVEFYYEDGKGSIKDIPRRSTFDSLDDKQLHHYLRWRTKAKNGTFVPMAGCYDLYISEIINGIGVKTPKEGLAMLKAMAKANRGYKMKDVINDYIIYHQMKDHYEECYEIKETLTYYFMDPLNQKLESDVLRLLHITIPDFGQQHCLYRDYKSINNTLIVNIFRWLPHDFSFFKEYIATYQAVSYHFFDDYIFDNVPKDTIIIHQGLHYDQEKNRTWQKVTYSSITSLKELNEIICECINRYFGIVTKELKNDALAAIVSKSVSITLAEYEFTVKDPAYLKYGLHSLHDTYLKLKTIKGKNPTETFILQAQELIGCASKPEFEDDLIILPECQSYDQLSERQLKVYLSERYGMRYENMLPSNFMRDGFAHLFLSEVINNIGYTEKQAVKILDSCISYGPYQREIETYLESYKLLHHLPLSFKDDEIIMDLDPKYSDHPDDYWEKLSKYNRPYNPIRSKFYQDYTDFYKELMFSVISDLFKDPTVFYKYLARAMHKKYKPYPHLIYNDVGDYEAYKISPVRTFYKKEGHYYYDYYKARPAKAFNYLVHEIERHARIALSYHISLKANRHVDEKTQEMIKVAVERFKEKYEESHRPVIYNRYVYEQIEKMQDHKAKFFDNFLRMAYYLEKIEIEDMDEILYPFPANRSYESLTYSEMRRYLIWRTNVRKNNDLGNSENFLYLYISEIINGIGVTSDEEALSCLKAIKDHYRKDRYQELVQQYIILHQMKEHYDELDHTVSNQEIVKRICIFVSDFGRNNCLYIGNEEVTNQLIYAILNQLLEKGILKQKVFNNNKKFFKDYIYQEHTGEITLEINGVIYQHDPHHGYWQISHHGFDENQLLYLDGDFNYAINDFYHVHHIISTDDLYPEVKKEVFSYLQSHTYEIKDSYYLFEIRHKDIYERIAQMHLVQETDPTDQFLKQAAMLVDITIEDDIGNHFREYAFDDDEDEEEDEEPYDFWDYYRGFFDIYEEPDDEDFHDIGYEDLNDDAIITYLYYRTKLRKKEYVSNLDPFYLLLYCAELANDIGVRNAKEGLEAFDFILKLYHDEVDDLDTYYNDYIITHQMAEPLINEESIYNSQLAMSTNLCTSPSDFFFLLMSLPTAGSRYKVKSSIMYKKDPKAYKEMIYQLFMKLDQDPSLHFWEYAFAEPNTKNIEMFRQLPYRYPKDDFAPITINIITRIAYEHHHFVRKEYDYTSRYQFSYILHEIDRHLREINHIPQKLKPWRIDPAIDQAIEIFLENKDAAPVQVELHLDQLGKIREDAVATCEQLITDEEKEIEQEDTPIVQKGEEDVLSDDEINVLKLLMNHQSISNYISSHHLITNIVIDSINEKLFDEIGDNVIEFDGDTPIIIDDYLDDLNEFLTDTNHQ